jgi:hypothetical protein
LKAIACSDKARDKARDKVSADQVRSSMEKHPLNPAALFWANRPGEPQMAGGCIQIRSNLRLGGDASPYLLKQGEQNVFDCARLRAIDHGATWCT